MINERVKVQVDVRPRYFTVSENRRHVPEAEKQPLIIILGLSLKSTVAECDDLRFLQDSTELEGARTTIVIRAETTSNKNQSHKQ